MSLLEEHIARNGADGLNQVIVNQSKKSGGSNPSYTTAQKSGGTTLLEEYIAQNGTKGLNLSVMGKTSPPETNTAQVDAGTKRGKATSTPGKISALGAGDYGANSDTRTDNIIRAGGYLTASGLAKLGSLLAGGTGELSMGQSAMAAVKGESQQELEAKKKAKQGKSAKVKLDKLANELYDTAMPSYEKATAPLSENNPIVKFTKAMGNGELSMGESVRAYDNSMSIEDAMAEKAKRQQTDVSGKLGKLAGELGINAVQMAMDAVTGPAALLTMGGRATGSRALELEKLGKSETEQLIGGLTSGMIEVLTEKIGGPFEKIYGKTALSKLTSKFVNSLSKSPAGRAAAKIMADFVSEGVEEVLSDILNPIADKLTGISEADWDWDEMYGDDWTEQWAYDFLVGGILGMTGSGANLITESISTNSQKSAIADKIIENSNEDALINTALETGGKAAELVEEYTKSKNARMLSDIYDAVQEITLSDAVNSRLQELGEKNTEDVAEGIVSYILGKSETAPEGKLAQRAQTELIDAFNGNLQSTNGWALDAIDDMADFSRGILEESGVTKTEETPAEEAPVNENAPAELKYREGSTPTWDADNIVESMFPEEVKDGILTKQDIDSAQSMYDNSGRQNLDEVQSMLEDYIKQVKEERQNGRNNDMDGSMGRQSRESTGVESGKVQSRAEGDKGTDGVGEHRADAGRESLRREAESGTESKVSAKELGIEDGTDEKNNSVVPEHKWSKAEKAIAKAFGPAANGFTLVSRNLSLKNGKANGAKTADGKIVVSRSSRLYKSEQLMIHEGGHLYLDDDIQLVDKLRSAAIEEMSEKEIDELTAAYALKWKGLYGDEEAFDRAANGELDTQELEEFNRKYVTEMLCDALGGIDRAGTKGTSKFSEAVREAFKAETGIDIDSLLSGEKAEAKTESKETAPVEEPAEEKAQAPPEEPLTMMSAEEAEEAESKAAEEEIEAIAQEAVSETPESAIEDEDTGAHAAAEAKKQAGEIQDFGEKIGGARKDVWAEAGLTTFDMLQMTEVEKGKYVKKDSVWPKINYQEMVDTGIDKDVAFFIKQVRDALPGSPQVKYTDTNIDARREQYIDFVRAVRSTLENVRTKADALNAFNDIMVSNGWFSTENASSYSRGHWTQAGTNNIQITNKLINALSVSERRWNYDVVKKMEKAQFLVAKDEKLPAGVQVKLYNGDGYSRNEKWQPGTWYVTKGYTILSINFASEKAAREWAQENVSQSKDGKKRFIPKQLETIHRTGRDYRKNNSENISGEDYMESFGFRGGEFGNWVNQNERQTSLNYGYDALMDLANILGIEPASIALDGRLAIAFGARGHSAALAHFEPDREVINLTKMKGAGSLAHEWLHALDYIGGKILGQQKSMIEGRYKLDIPELTKLLEDMKSKPASEAEIAQIAEQSENRRISRAESFINGYFKASDMTAEQLTRFDELKAEMKNGKDNMRDAMNLAEEFSDLRKEYKGRVIPKEERERFGYAIYSRITPNATMRTATEFYKNSKRFDSLYAKENGAGYWSSDEEMMARAFACYVTDKLAEQDLVSDYLSGHSENAIGFDVTPSGDLVVIKAIPTGEERELINKDFDALLEVLKEKGVLKSAEPATEEYAVTSYSIEDDESGELTERRDSYSIEDEALAEEEAQRRKNFKSTVNKESLTKLNERMARLDGAINGYERTENRSEKMERELAEMKADRAAVEKVLKAKKAKAELEKRARKNAKAEAEAALDNLSVRRTTAQSRKAAKQQIFKQFGIESGRTYVGNSIDAFLDKWIEQGKIGSKDIDALEASLMEMGAFKIESANDFAQEVRSRMYNGQISVPESVVREFGDNWDAIRQRAFAARIYLSVDSNHAGIDQWTKDLANSFGIGQFDESLDLAAQLENIIDIAEEGKAENMSVYELAERTRRLEGPDVADAYLEEMHDKLMQTLKSFSQSAKIEMDIVKKNAYAQIRDDALRKEKAERAAQERAQREFQQKTLKQLQWLKRNQNFMGTDFQEEAKRILADIDTIAVSAANEMNWSDKYNATWEDLAKMYKWAKENDSNFLPNKELENILARIDGTHLDELNASDLENIYKAAVALRTAYYNRNNIIGDELHRTFAEAYEGAVTDMREAEKPKNMTGRARKIADSQLNPINRIQRMFGWKEDSAGFEIFGRGLEKGERQTKRYVEQANQILDEWMEANKEWVAKADGQGEDAIWYELEVPELMELKMGDKPIFGETVKVSMTPMQKIYMYLESKNYDNLRHMVGGRTFVNKELYSEGKKQEAFAQGTTISLAPETVKKLVADLTPIEMELATILDRQYFNGYAKTEINRVSNILYGYDRAMSDNYAPIYTNHNYNRAEPGMTQDGTAEGVGHMKTRVQGAKNPTYNISALEAFQKHVSQTSRFVGMAIPAQNAETLLNWHGNGTNMQEEITHNWSQGELDSLKGVMQELQAPTYLEQSEFAGFIGNLMSNYIGGVFGANITVAAKVLASEPTAAIILGGEYYPSVSQKRAVNTNLISKYTSELDVRIRGYGTPELAAMTLSTSKYMQWVQSHKATKLFLGGGLLQAADIYVTKTMWPWAENKVREEFPELEVGTQEQIDNGTSPFYKKVAEVYEDAIGYTQSMYDIMHRSDIMRDKNEITRSFTIFHTDSLQAMNLIRKRAGELDTAKAALKKAQSDAEKTAAQAKVNTTAKKMAACVGNVILMNVMVTLFDMLRDAFRKRRDKYENDEGEVTFWSATSNGLVQLVENTAGLFIGADTIIPALTSIFTDEKYYSHELIAIETLNDIIDLGTDTLKGLGDFAGGLLNIIREDGDVWKYVREDGDFRGVIKDAAEKLTHYFTGVPVENVERLITNAIGWIFPQVEAAYDGLWSNGSKKALAESNALDADIKGLYNGRADISDETASELARLYEAGYKNAIMSDTPTSLSYDGEEYKLSAAQQQTYDETVKRYLHPFDEMMQSPEYLSADDETKAKMVNRFYDYAKDMAKAKVIEGYEVEGFAANVPEWRDQGISWGRIMSGDTQDNTRYAKYVTAGVNEQDAAEIFDTVEALEPEFGHDNVTAQQKVMAISYLPISESSKQAAMKVVYGNSEAAYDRYMISCNHGVASADYADFLNILEGIDKNGGNPNQAEFTEAINRSRIDEDTARDLWYNGYGWKKTSPWG